jgi:hypothetical protein
MIGTDDPQVAVQMIALAAGMIAPTPPPAQVMPTPHPGLPPAVPSTAPPPPAAAAAPPPPSAAPPPPAAVTAPPAPPAAAPPPPPAAAPAAAPPAEHDAQDQAILDAGWTVEHMRATAQTFVKKHGNVGPAKIAEMCAKYLPPGTAKPVVTKVPPKWWPQLHAELNA